MDTPLRNADGSVSMLAVRRDITARKLVDERLKSLTRTLKGRVTSRTAAIKRQLARVHALSVELAEAEQNERRRLALVLHDHLQQILSAAKIRIGGLARRAPEKGLQREIQVVGDLLAEALVSARSLTVELCPPPLCEEGLAEAIRWLARHVEERHGLAVAVEAPSDALPNDPGIGALLFRIVNELLFNVVKHAGVKAARVRIGRLGSDRVRLVVSDAGVGFKQAGTAKGEDAATGLGLAGIRRRLDQLGGRLEIRSEPGRGTRVAVTAPMSVAPVAVTRAVLKRSDAAPRAAARP
jgi:signal transduction histidine kinase